MKIIIPDLKIADFMKAIPKELRRPDELRSWSTLLRCFFFLVLFQVSLYFLPSLGLANVYWNAPLHLILILFSGLSMVGLFVLCHDCGHYSFSKRRWVNDAVGFICFIPLLNSFFAWRAAHNFHHQHNQTRRVDPDWVELLATEDEYARLPWYEKLAIRIGPGNPIGILVGFWAGMLKRSFFGLLIPQMKMSSRSAAILYALNLFSASCSLTFLLVYADFLSLEKFLVMYGAPVIVATSTGAFLTFIQHSHPGSYVFDKGRFDPVLSHVHSTFNIRFPAWLEFFWLDINVHTPHHILPGVPWYFLKEANEKLKREFPEHINERAFCAKELKEAWHATTLSEVREGVFQIIPDKKTQVLHGP